MIYVIGSNGYIGSNLMREFPNAIGITRDTKWPEFNEDDVVINCASYFWRGKDINYVSDVESTNVAIPNRLRQANALVIQLSSTAAHAFNKDIVWIMKHHGDLLLRGKAHTIYLPTVYGGINQHKHMFMTALLDHIQIGAPITLECPKDTRDIVHISVLIKTIKQIIQGQLSAIEPITLTCGQYVSFEAITNIAEGITLG